MKRIVLLMTLALAFAAMPGSLHAQAMPPMECLGLPSNDWIDIQDSEFASGAVAPDTAASDGYAVEVQANEGRTATYYITPSQAGTWHCYASIRCQSIDTSGVACSVIIYDNSTSSWMHQEVDLENGAVDGQYHQYDLGVQQLTDTMEFTVSAPNTTDTTVYVDRYFLMAPAAPGAAATVPSMIAGFPANDWIDVLPKDFSLGAGPVESGGPGGGPVSLVSDPAAAGGYAAEVPVNAGWNADYYVPASQVGTWHCYASIKCSSIDTAGTACDVGIYYGSTGTWTWVGVNLQNGAANGQYQIYDLGVQQLNDTAVFFVAAQGDYDTTVYVDRYFMVARPAAAPPPECVGLPASDWIDIQDNEFASAPSVPDPAASDLWAKEVVANAGWTATYYITPSQVGTWHCYASVRCSSIDTAGVACSVILWDNSAGWVASDDVYLQNGAGDGQYHQYDLGIHQLTDTMEYTISLRPLLTRLSTLIGTS